MDVLKLRRMYEGKCLSANQCQNHVNYGKLITSRVIQEGYFLEIVPVQNEISNFYNWNWVFVC